MRGPILFAGYLEDEAATRAVMRDGWLRTGDIGFVDEDGYLYVLGRTRTLIKRGGVTIIPRDVEDAAGAVEGVIAAAAFGAAVAGEETEGLLVVVEADLTGADEQDRRRQAEAVERSVLEALAVVPSEVIMVGPGAIPRTENGKIRYGELRGLAEAGHLRGALRR